MIRGHSPCGRPSTEPKTHWADQDSERAKLPCQAPIQIMRSELHAGSGIADLGGGIFSLGFSPAVAAQTFLIRAMIVEKLRIFLPLEVGRDEIFHDISSIYVVEMQFDPHHCAAETLIDDH